MAYYSSPKDMFEKRAESYKRQGDCHWGKAKNGEGNYHYGKAKSCYNHAAANREKADKADSAWDKKK